MKQGGHLPKGANGFTIVETLIVLAVSAMLVASAIILINGRANKTQFMTAANDLKQSLEQVINETATGYFPNSGDFTCQYSSGTAPKLTIGSASQGTNGGCIFLGKALQFGVSDDSDVYLTYPIAGNRIQAASTQEVTRLQDSYPVAVAAGVGFNSSLSGIKTVVRTPIQSGLTVGTMRDDASRDINGFAFLTTFATYSTTATGDCNGVCSGAQSLNLYSLPGNKPGTQNSAQFVDVLDGGYTKYSPAKQITLCMNSGFGNQSVVYKIGSGTGSQSVDMEIQTGVCT